ncbi:MAG: TonB-dependent receptor [Candidatus Aminicenantes bacterium]|nr:TonB-dependent receptor [Candidatus Aminicenantes bacterium]
MKNKIIILALILVLLAGGAAFAQINPEGKITGKVVDDQGNPLPGVTVEATSPKLVGKAATVTDASGTYRLLALPSGTYELTFSLPGFKTLVRKDIVLQLSQTLVVNVTMEPAAIEEQVTVVGQSPLIDVKSTVKGQVMTKETFLTLPRGRTFDSLISTVPGVQNEGIAGGLSVDGASGAENMWYVDGTNVTEIHVGTRAQNVVLELVDEVKVTASGYNAEFGGSMGGVVNVITRSGGNTFHGDVMGYYENNKLWMQGKARDYLRLDPYDPTTQHYEYVNDDDLYFNGGKNRDNYYRIEGIFSLGGYIIKDRLWFFGSINPIYSQTAALRDFNQRQGPFYTFLNKNYNYNGSLKLTAAPMVGLRLSASFVNNFSRWKGTIPPITGTGNPNTPYYMDGYDYPNWSAAFTADYTGINNLLISLRGGWHRQDVGNQGIKPPAGPTYYFRYPNTMYADDPFYQDHPELLHYAGWSNSATWLNLRRELREKISGNLDVTYYMNLAGEHAWKAGAQFIWLHENYDYTPNAPRINLYWNRSSTFGRGTYGYYIIRHGYNSYPYGWFWNIHSNNWALYLQDSWTISNRLTINFGVRTESEYIPSFSNEPGLKDMKPIKFDFLDKLAPRFGVVYDVFGDSSLKVFGSFGIYYDVMKLYLAEGAFGGFKWKNSYFALNNPDWTLIAANFINTGNFEDLADQAPGGNQYLGTIDFRYPSFDAVDPDIKPVSQMEISFGAEKKIMENLSFSARAVYKHLIRTIEDIGAYEEVAPGQFAEIYMFANPGYGWARPQSQGGRISDEYWPMPKAKRDYYGLNLSLEKRFSNNWQGGINYTLSRVQGNYGGLASSDEGGRVSPNVERYFDYWFMPYKADGTPLDGPLPHDRTHYIKAYGSYVFPFGLTVGFTAYARSGYPLSTRINLCNTYMWPNGYGDLGRLPWTAWADVYLEYTLKLADKYRVGINLQVNNITNTKTIQGKVFYLNRVGSRYYTDYPGTRVWFEDAMLNGTFKDNWYEWFTHDPAVDPHPAFGWWTSRFGTWSMRLGFKFTF